VVVGLNSIAERWLNSEPGYKLPRIEKIFLLIITSSVSTKLEVKILGGALGYNFPLVLLYVSKTMLYFPLKCYFWAFFSIIKKNSVWK